MIGFRDPGYRFFEPSDRVECVECHEIVHEDLAREATTGEVLCYECVTDWGVVNKSFRKPLVRPF